jgi:hypothetical protein
MKTNTETLDGPALIWAMCIALGHTPVSAATGIAYRSDHGSWVYPRFTDDSEVGPLMMAEKVGVERPFGSQAVPLWRAITDTKGAEAKRNLNWVVSAHGTSPGVAVCRAIVLSRCGVSVDIPEQLTQK